MDPVQKIWDDDLRRQNQAAGVQITTESYNKWRSKFEGWAVNMDRCDIPWDVLKQEDTLPRFILRWNRDLTTWECDRVIFPKATTAVSSDRS